MRRKDREIIDKSDILEILKKADACRLAFGGLRPYIVALNYGFIWDEQLIIYFHSAKVGKKIDLIQKYPQVCFQIDTDHELVMGSSACDWGMKYGSITGYGHLSILENDKDKIEGLHAIMNHYGFSGTPEYDANVFSNTLVLKLTVTEMSCKRKN